MNLSKLLIILYVVCFHFSNATQLISQQSEKQYGVASIGFYNVENLFDTIDDPQVSDTEFTPDGSKVWTAEKLEIKLQNIVTVINDLGKSINPDGIALLGLAEVENRRVLDQLVQHNNLENSDWNVVHYESKDTRGIDVALMYREKYFRVLDSKTFPLVLYNSKGEKRTTRDILYVKGILVQDTIAVMVNHWPSRRGGEKATQRYRMEGAKICKDVLDSVKSIQPDILTVIMGDLNDDPVSPSVKKVLEAKGKPGKTSRDGYYNPMYNFYKKGHGTNAYRDSWSSFDQIILSGSLLPQHSKGKWQYYKAEIYRKGFLLQGTGRFKGYPFRTFAGDSFLGGYSDHLPVVVHLIREL